MKARIGLLLIIIVLLSSNCVQAPTDHYSNYVAHYSNLNDSKASKIVKSAIEYCGGWEAFTSIKGFEYVKTSERVDSLGNVTSSSSQLHRYNLFPEYKIRMDWKDDVGDEYVIINKGSQAWKLKNEIKMEDQQDVNNAYNASYGSPYVMFVPWKLADPGLQMEYCGLSILRDGRDAECVKITYTDVNSTTTDHTWWYYFEPETAKPLANFLKYSGGYSYTEYLDFASIHGMKFNNSRKSYQSDSTMNQLKLATIYSNKDIKLLDSFDSDLFELND